MNLCQDCVHYRKVKKDKEIKHECLKMVIFKKNYNPINGKFIDKTPVGIILDALEERSSTNKRVDNLNTIEVVKMHCSPNGRFYQYKGDWTREDLK